MQRSILTTARSLRRHYSTTTIPSPSYPSRIVGIPQTSTTRSRPLTFPLGSFVGFLVGFTTASVAGYLYLLQSHNSLQHKSQLALLELQHTIDEVQRSAQDMLGGTTIVQLRESVRDLEGKLALLANERDRLRTAREEARVESRVVGVEEELVEVREALLGLEQYLNLTPASTARSQVTTVGDLRQQLSRIGIQDSPEEVARKRSGGLQGGVLWTGRNDGRRLV